jgi:L-fuculose-phosphate aldolase
MASSPVDGSALRRAQSDLLRQCHGLAERGLVLAAAGNASVAVGEHLLLTGTGAEFGGLEPADLVLVDRSGQVIDAEGRRPTSELALHLAAHRRPGVDAVVHTHGRHAVALSTLLKVVPALHYYCVDLGGPVPVAPYRCYGTEELATVTIAEMADRRAVVMAHHGSLTVGSSLAQAGARAELLEWLCQVALLARAAGTPAELSAQQLDEVRQAARA